MRANSEKNIRPHEIAISLNISYSWFRRIFKQYTGFSPAQYQMEIKMQHSKDLLSSSTMSIKEISFALNFLSASYFVTFFKSKNGMSPSDTELKYTGKTIKPNEMYLHINLCQNSNQLSQISKCFYFNKFYIVSK
jgi:AraC-like DNA-binding protein